MENLKCDEDSSCATIEKTSSAYYMSKRDHFQVTVINPAGSGSINGLQVIRQIIPMRESSIQVIQYFYSLKTIIIFMIVFI